MENIHELPKKSVFPRNGKGDNQQISAPRIPKLNFGRGRENPHYTPWLVVRADYGDFGDRPLPSGSVFWESPDVWVESSQGINQPVVGEANHVFARVSNFGLQNATGIMVKFWWANPSMAITESNAHLIGIGYADVPSGWSVKVPCPVPWVPVVENGGHECLIAEAFIQGSDPLTAPMDPLDDRHVGQKNEQLILLKKGASFIVRIGATNITDAARALRFDVQALPLETIHPLVQLRAQTLPVNPRPASTRLPLSLSLDRAASLFAKPSILFAERLLLRGLHKVEEVLEDLEHAQVNHAATFEPWETRTLELTGRVPRDAEPGESYLFRAVQRIGNMVTGGYTVHIVVVE